ncbi:MAG: sulfurtransferase [Erythrobacter sp.]|uniref:sulfurtransferase n=1 Tax=Erythrobacter sp. TaxID=1042 RepID=UPI0026086C68|nr:sulfurtransferase [Erythrobacter sp.]MDJ0979936.1 sulfurtransferase [Erythrobacter sp.]
MTEPRTEPIPSLVSTQWLDDHLADPRVVVLDASKHLPDAGRNPREEYETGHIPGARFLDLDSLTDTSSCVPAALPTPEQVARRLADLGVTLDDRIVLYDDSAVRTSARAWFALTAHGVKRVAILDGGLAKWRGEGRALESGTPDIAATEPATLVAPRGVVTKRDVLSVLDGEPDQIVDARAADRVYGPGEDPVHGGQNGRIPGALNLPFGQVFDDDGLYRSPGELRAAFEGAGVDLTQPIITSCGSGVTASVLLFALHLAGKDDVSLYDGSWQEWSADPDTPKAQGPE